MRIAAKVPRRTGQPPVFVDGCFWHGCPDHASWPKSNAAWWRAKIERNRSRDAETTKSLSDAGWLVVRVWEHEAPEDAASRIEAAIEQRAQERGAGGRLAPGSRTLVRGPDQVPVRP